MTEGKTPNRNNHDNNNNNNNNNNKYSKSSSSLSPTSSVVVSFKAVKSGPHCPFRNSEVEFELKRGGCVCLAGNSGAGKTTLSMYLAGLSTSRDLRRLDITVVPETSCVWDPSIPQGERCGVLFQQTTLLDDLTIAGNVYVALREHAKIKQQQQSDSINCGGVVAEGSTLLLPTRAVVKQLLESVGLDYIKDGGKRPSQLSGGMARRASLALQLAQRKHVIVLDEPFTGLDMDAAKSVAKALVSLRVQHGTALLLISHEPHLAQLVMDPKRTTDNVIVNLDAAATSNDAINGDNIETSRAALVEPSLFGLTGWERFLEKLVDYIGWSLPLIGLTFFACGLAISMLSLDILAKIDITDQVIGIVDTEVKPMLKFLTGQEENALQLMMVKMKVRGMINTVLPQAKASLFATGMAKLFVLEIGPLLTALLLCGRIGGSYAGKVATMQATAQNKLLQTLGINPQRWTLLPAMAAAVLASPILTVFGTALALFLGGTVGPSYGIGTFADYQEQVRKTIFPGLRLRSFMVEGDAEVEVVGDGDKVVETMGEEEESDGSQYVVEASSLTSRGDYNWDWRPIWSDDNENDTASLIKDATVEVATYPPVFLLLKATTYIVIILLVAEACARIRSNNLTPRHVPQVITSSVVIASLLVIITDWGFSQLWLLRK